NNGGGWIVGFIPRPAGHDAATLLCADGVRQRLLKYKTSNRLPFVRATQFIILISCHRHDISLQYGFQVRRGRKMMLYITLARVTVS
ncbi:MAG: hypothetical protein ACFNM6_08625, partial [Prevotella sp.]